ncbi:hypothetical protein OROGR_019179 [Orobanche gracilis]
MGNSTAVSRILGATTLLLLLLSPVMAHRSHRKANNNNNVSPFCTTATTSKDKALCTGIVKKDAKSWAEAMTNAIKAVIEIANTHKSRVVDGVGVTLPPSLKPLTKESITRGCSEAFDTYVYNLQQCIGFVRSDPYSSLETYLSGSTFFDCKDGFDEFQLSNPDVDKFYDTTLKFADILISIYQNKPQQNL